MLFAAIILLCLSVPLLTNALHLETNLVIYSGIWIGIRSLSTSEFLLAQTKRYITRFLTDHGVHSLSVLLNNEC